MVSSPGCLIASYIQLPGGGVSRARMGRPAQARRRACAGLPIRARETPPPGSCMYDAIRQPGEDTTYFFPAPRNSSSPASPASASAALWEGTALVSVSL